MDILALSIAVKKALAELGVKTVITKTTILEPATAEFTENDGLFGAFLLVDSVPVITSNELIISFDGVAYKCKIGSQGYGNHSIFNHEDENTGEPFLLWYGGEGWVCITTDTAPTTHTVAIYEETETIHPIDPKFLPGVCLPVVELSTDITAGMTELSANESKALDEVAASPAPLVVIFPAGEIVTSAICWKRDFQTYNTIMYIGAVSVDGEGMQVIVAKDEGKWIAQANAVSSS